MPREDVLRGLRDHVDTKHPHRHSRTQAKGTNTQALAASRSHSGGSLNSNSKSIKGLLHQYMPQNGVQYYRDLAGNIKQVCTLLSILVQGALLIYYEILDKDWKFCTAYACMLTELVNH